MDCSTSITSPPALVTLGRLRLLAWSLTSSSWPLDFLLTGSELEESPLATLGPALVLAAAVCCLLCKLARYFLETLCWCSAAAVRALVLLDSS